MAARLYLIKHAIRDADIDDADNAATQFSRKQTMTRLLSKERHSPVSPDSNSLDLSVKPADAAREIDACDFGITCVDGRNKVACITRYRPDKPGAKQGIDDTIAPDNQFRGPWLQRNRTLFARLGRVPRQFAFIAQKPDTDAISALSEDPGGDEPVSSIVAGTAHHSDFSPDRMAGGNLIGHGETRLVHQSHSRNPAGDCLCIRLRHFFRGQQFIHGDRSSRTLGSFDGPSPLEQSVLCAIAYVLGNWI